jgi:RHS repeat-associated protein
VTDRFILLAVILLVVTGVVFGATNVSGAISSDTTWDITGSPFVVSAVTVASGVTLTIAPGVVVKLMGPSNSIALRVTGTLLANGTAAQPIYFTSFLDDSVGGDTNGDGNATTPKAGDWGIIFFNSSSASCSFSNVTVRYGGGGGFVGMIFGNGALSITNSTLSDSASSYAVDDNGPAVTITGCTFLRNANGMSAGGGSVSIINNIFSTTRSDAIDASSGSPTISGNIFAHNSIGVAVSNGATPHIHNNSFQLDATYGVLNVNCNTASACSTTPNVDATNNYWGSPSGPWLNPPAGPGDRVSFHVNYMPFLGTPAGNAPTPAQTLIGPTGSTTNQTASTKDPINTATGNYYLTRSDVVVPGKGLPFNFNRSYNTQDSYVGPLGAGWTHSYNIILTADPDTGNVSVKEGDGHLDFWSPAGAGVYVPATIGLFDMLQQNPDGSFTLIRKNQTQFNFSSSGQLTSVVDRNGNMQLLAYDRSGNLASITDSAGRVFIFTTDTNGHITSLTDPTGRIWQYVYDANNNLVSVRDPAGGLTLYNYDANHQMTSAVDPRGVKFLQNAYDVQGRVLTQTNGRGFVTSLTYGFPGAGITTITDPIGNTARHVYDAILRITNIIDANDATVSYTYDANNDRISITNQNGNTTNFSYDAQGNVTGITDPLGNAQTFTYDSKNDLLSATNAKSNTTTFSYDAKGNLTTVQDALGNTTSFLYDGSGLLTSKTNARGNATSFTYDASANLVKITDPLGNSTALGYDGIGRLLSLTDPNAHTAAATYDALSQLVNVADPLSNITRFAYDGVGNLLKITDANGNATSYVYDATNNLATVSDALGQVTSYAYDANNNRVSFLNAKGNASSYAYDAMNRLAKSIDPLSFVTLYSYDAAGNVRATTDANGKTNQYAYDALNRLIKGSFADGSSVGYSYDKDGNRTSMVDSRGTTAYTYDPLDRLLSVNSPNGAVVQYGYDTVGNRTTLAYPDGRVVQYQYDALNRLSQATDWSSKTTRYSYDAGGNLAGFVYPNGTASTYSYDAANRLFQIVNHSGSQVLSSFTYSLDSIGNRLQATSAAGGTTKYGYDALYRLTSWTVPSGQATQYIYDPAGNRLSMNNSAGTTPYAYDAADRLLSSGATTYVYDNNGNQISKSTGSTTVNYNYDALNRLIAVTGGGLNSQYQYDGDGNRVGQTVPAGTYQYLNDTAAPLSIALNETGPDGNIDYLYGLSMISETSGAFQYYYQSDGLGSTATLTDAVGSLKANYAYDPWGKLAVPIDPLGTKNKYKFTGEALDPGSGLQYLHARYYDSAIGRFVTRDPLGGTARNPNSKNQYAYAFSSPTNFIDRTGLSPAAFQFQTYLGAGPIDFSNAGSTLAVAQSSCSNCVPFDLVGNVAALGGDIYKAATGSDIRGLDLAGVGLDVAQRLDSGQSLAQALLYAGVDWGVDKAIGLAATRLLGSTGGLVLVTAYDATKVGAAIGTIPAVQSFVSQQEFSILNWIFGPTRVEQWSTSPIWTGASNFGNVLTKLP